MAFVDHRDHVHKTLFFKLHTRLAAEGLDLVHVDSQEIGTMGALKRAVDEEFAGAFVWPKVASIDPATLTEVQASMPVIAVDHSIGGEPSDIVMSDHCLGARLLVTHLAKLGRRRIAISGNFTNMEDAQLRFNGYLLGQYENSIAPEACNFVFSSPQPDIYEDPRLLRYRLADEDRPDAVFVLHDMSVPSIVDTIMDAGLSVPEDVAVVGFGNDLPLSIERVGLTTIAMNWDAVAEALASRMQERLSNPSAPFGRTMVPVKLVVRGSCGAPPDQWSHEGYEVSSVTTTRRMRPVKPQSESAQRFQKSFAPDR
jgi:LacI family transcriptional regulator